ncbi:MAG: DUF1015 domain-containing protein [Actinomycetota bacterium]|nr:DUF1015 domain-containing protein [Actinomycetota bacterium]
MPRFEPFAGLRYADGAGPLADLVAPPYDVVSPADRGRLASRSPHNSILVELPLADDTRGTDRYATAAALLADWERDGILRRDLSPALYVYRMTYESEEGATRSTTGVIGALGLDPVGGGEILPHERTMPKPKGDRLDLLRACRANLSPIWGLSLTEGLASACAAATESAPAPISAADEDGVLHELWTVTDPESIEPMCALVAATPVVIADGHHRYETATFYRTERQGASGGAPGAYDLVMALVVELTADELVVRAIHRLVSGLPADFDVTEALSAFFSVLEGPADPSGLPAAMAREGALGVVLPEGTLLLVPTPEVLRSAEADLDSSRLDVALAGFPAHELTYQHGATLAADAVARGDAQVAFLLRPATVGQIAETAHSGRRMPPKTTFFHPKPRTGMVFRPVPD